MGFEDELRLAYAVTLNAVALAAAYRFAGRRIGGDLVRRLIDAGLIYYVLQYVVVGALGLVGLLSPWTIGPMTLMLCALLWVGSGWRRDERKITAPAAPEVPGINGVVMVACLTFVAVYAFAFVYQQRHLPPTADDALTYHLPAAVQWLQTGRIDLFHTWFFNPANTYSPLAGSVFIAWLIAPLGNDTLARYVQAGPLVLLFLVVAEVARLLGARGATAALVALACVMTRSFVNQAIVPKDDLFLTVFGVAAVVALAPQRADEPWAPWRLGTALGLLLATKYTAMYTLPILLLMIDVPFRHARWRRGGIAAALLAAGLLAGPWLVRNAAVTGNPLAPIDVRIGGVHVLDGLFPTARSVAMSTPRGIFNTLVGGIGFYGPPTAVIAVLLVGWITAIALNPRGVYRDALWRACVVGSMLSIGLFALSAPYAEVRFVYPAIALLFAVFAGTAARIPRGGDVAAAGALLLLALGFTLHDSGAKQGFAVVALVVAGVTAAMFAFAPPRVRLATAALLAVCVAGYAYVNWRSYLRDYLAGRGEIWAAPTVHGELGRAWAVVDRDVPRGSLVAYANTHYVYPLQGPALRNRVVYAPTIPNVRTLYDLRPAPAPLAGEQIPDFFADQLRHRADAITWRKNLADGGADYLFVAKGPKGPAPELGFIAQRRGAFELLYDGPAAAIYRVRVEKLLDD